MATPPLLNIKKVEKRSTEVQATDTLRDAIISGDIPLGARLTELGASETLGVSRSTIRAALHQLVQERLIVQVPYTGWTVMTLSARDAWELYTLRASLEALAAKLVAQKLVTPAAAVPERAALTTAFDGLKAACAGGAMKAIAAADMALHQSIVSASGHRMLTEQYARIRGLMLIYIRSSDTLATDAEQIVRQHLPLVEALLKGDAEAAVHNAVVHNETEGAILIRHLERTQG